MLFIYIYIIFILDYYHHALWDVFDPLTDSSVGYSTIFGRIMKLGPRPRCSWFRRPVVLNNPEILVMLMSSNNSEAV